MALTIFFTMTVWNRTTIEQHPVRNFYTHLEAGHLMDNLKESFSGTKNLGIRNSRPEKKKIKLIFFYYKNKIKQFELTKL